MSDRWRRLLENRCRLLPERSMPVPISDRDRLELGFVLLLPLLSRSPELRRVFEITGCTSSVPPRDERLDRTVSASDDDLLRRSLPPSRLELRVLPDDLLLRTLLSSA